MIYCPNDTFDTLDLITDWRGQISNFAISYRYFLETQQDQGKVKFGLLAKQPNQVLSLQNAQIEPLRNRQTEQLRYLASNGHFYCATSQIDWRMVVGLGGNHVQETNMTLDHVHGIPYLPGSAFKGVVRSWVIQEYFCNNEELAMRDIEASDSIQLKVKKNNFFTVFGSQRSAGKVQFLDALPDSGVHFYLDIMNPHFSDYYTRSDFPTDDQSPIQIYFLTLKNTHFRFLMHAKTAGALSLARHWFMQAIANRGFGAKSAVGYGYFRELTDKTENLRYEFAEKLNLDEAYDIYCNNPSQHASVHINIEPLIDYTPKFAVIVAEEICEVASINGTSEIPDTLIEVEAGLVMPSEFGKWIWEKTKDKLFEKVLSEFPNLVYRSPFKRKFRNLSPVQCKSFQEVLLQVAIDFRRQQFANLEEFQEKLMTIAENSDESLRDKLLEIAANLEEGPTLLTNSLDNGHGTINVAEDYTIICNGIDDDGKLILREYTSP